MLTRQKEGATFLTKKTLTALLIAFSTSAFEKGKEKEGAGGQ